MRRLITILAISVLLLAVSGEVFKKDPVKYAANTWQQLTNKLVNYLSSCPMTVEEDIYLPVTLLKDEVNGAVLEWGNNKNTRVETEQILDDSWAVYVYENGCNTHTIYYYGTDD